MGECIPCGYLLSVSVQRAAGRCEQQTAGSSLGDARRLCELREEVEQLKQR